MKTLVLTSMVVVTLGISTRAHADGPDDSPRAIFLPIETIDGADADAQQRVAAVNSIIIEEFQTRLKDSVLTTRDLVDSGRLERLCAMYGCDESSAAANPRKALAKYLETVPLRLSGRLFRTSTNYVLSLDLVKSGEGRSERAKEDRIPLSDAALGFGAKVAVAKLFKQEVPTPNHYLRAWVPGFAQLSKDQKFKGGLIILGEIGLAAGGALALFMESEKREELRRPGTPSAVHHLLQSDAERLQQLAIAAFIAAGALYVYNVLDGFFSKDQIHYTLYD